MNRRKFLSYVGCGCCGFILNSCSTAPITERRQLKLLSETSINRQAYQIYEKVKQKKKLSTDKKQLDEIKDIDHQLEKAEQTLNWNSSGNYWKNDVMVFDNNNDISDLLPTGTSFKLLFSLIVKYWCLS